MKKFLTLFLALLMVMTTAVSYAEVTTDVIKEPITITFWEILDNETYDADLQKVVDAFNAGIGAEYGITVDMKVISGGTETMETQLVAAIRAGAGVPNVVMTEATYVPDYLLADAIVDLTPYIQSAEYGLDLSDYYDFFVNLGSSYTEEGTYTLPGYVSGEVMYYNKTFFEENGLTVPTTWDEMVETCTKITEITGRPAFGWDDPFKTFTTLITQAGAGYTDSQGNILFGGDNLQIAIDAIQWYKDQIDAGIFRTAGEDYYFSGPFGRGDVQLYIGSGNEAQWIQYKIPDGVTMDWACAPIPQGKEGWANVPADYSENFVYAIMDTNNDEAARMASWLFLRYLEQPENVYATTTSDAFMPYLKSVAESEEWLSVAGTAQKAESAQADAFYTYAGFDGASALRSDATTAIQDILVNGADVTETLTNLANR
ncbi:MAG: extracellular solute-binding protein [Clostridia bacterium]|nr:extracellular solute-binding protein [Clostridia bacterium]